MDPPARAAEERDAPGGAAFWTGVAVGGALLHDLLLAPLVVLAGVALTRLLPTHLRGPLAAATAISLLVGVYAIPLVWGFGRRAGNPSALPTDYGRDVVLVVAGVWVVALGVLLVRRWRST